MLRCLIFEDEHLLVVNKPAVVNTHAPSPFAGEGIYEWLRHREPRWAGLAIIHRLDKETSGVLVFAKSPLANRSLTAQFTAREVQKKYVLLSDHPPAHPVLTVRSALSRMGDKYVSTPPSLRTGQPAETRFEVVRLATEPRIFGRARQASAAGQKCVLIEAFPATGRTHQIRVHAAESGFPILGDVLYGGTPASRVFLHASELAFKHPLSGKPMSFRAPTEFDADPRLALRTALIESDLTNAYRLRHGAADGFPNWYVDRLGEYLLSQGPRTFDNSERAELTSMMKHLGIRTAYHKTLSRQVRRTSLAEASPALVLGESAPEHFEVRENGLRFELSLAEGYSIGLFLDQRDNRRRLLKGYVSADFLVPVEKGALLLNTFAYTCGFSVAAAQAGYHTTSLDLSRKYLEWGKRNFTLNGLEPSAHEFIYGDAFDWLRRLVKKNRLYEVILLDPPTFSGSKQSGIFRVERDYGRLVAAALPLLKTHGVLFASTNATDWAPEAFLTVVEEAIRAAKRKILQKHYVPQPPDFPVSRAEPVYLKTVWLRVG